jgi:hypothetical protein
MFSQECNKCSANAQMVQQSEIWGCHGCHHEQFSKLIEALCLLPVAFSRGLIFDSEDGDDRSFRNVYWLFHKIQVFMNIIVS